MTAIQAVSIPLHGLGVVKVTIVNEAEALVEPVLGCVAMVHGGAPHASLVTLADLPGENGRDDDLFAEALLAGGSLIVELERIKRISPTAARILLTRKLDLLDEEMSPAGRAKNVFEAAIAEVKRIGRERRGKAA